MAGWYDNPEIDAEIALGQALGATLLTGALLKRLVQKGLFSDPEVVDLIDQALLGMEKIQEKAGASKKAVSRARQSLEAVLGAFSGKRGTSGRKKV